MTAADQQQQQQQQQQQIDLLTTWITLGLGRGDWSLLTTTFAEDYRCVTRTGVIEGRAALREALAGLRVAFPDLTVRVEECIAAPDRVVLRTVYCGTQQGTFMGVPATGRTLTWSGMTIYHLRAGVVCEEWALWDGIALAEQLGLRLAPVAPGADA